MRCRLSRPFAQCARCLWGGCAKPDRSRPLPCRVLPVAVWALLLFTTLPADALRCDHGNVNAGDRAFSVRQKCGDPDYVDRHSEAFVPGAGLRR
ncbi:MAG: DUF2845 domain-containing protein [Nitrococcus mobilis]|nr:DUF2845 domain-containing protein [Nitrococcus mobilis]